MVLVAMFLVANTTLSTSISISISLSNAWLARSMPCDTDFEIFELTSESRNQYKDIDCKVE